MPSPSPASLAHHRFSLTARRTASLLGSLSLIATQLLSPAGAVAASPISGHQVAASEGRSTAAIQTISFPDTTAGQRFSAWLAAFNSGDAAEIRAFHSSPSAPDRLEDRVVGDLEGYRETGGIDVFRVTTDGPYQLIALARSRTFELWAEIVFRVAPDGIQHASTEGTRIVGHGGGAPGISAMLHMYPEHGYTVAVLSNYSGAAPAAAFKIRDLLDR